MAIFRPAVKFHEDSLEPAKTEGDSLDGGGEVNHRCGEVSNPTGRREARPTNGRNKPLAIAGGVP
jgi:hypothetical protein